MPKKGYKQSNTHKSSLRNFLIPFKKGDIPHNKKNDEGTIESFGSRKKYYQNYELKRKFNITIHDYENILKSQDCRCAICGGYQIENRKLAVDHNHRTGKIRGLLCNSCNAGIGFMKENKQTLQNAISYLEIFEE